MKRTKFLLAFATFLAFSISLWIAPEANAVPAFARQTGLACSTCHFQHYPALNAFGRAFKSNGYTQIGGEGKVEGEDLSIPDTLNASLVTKVRYQKTNGKDYTGNLTNGSSGTNRGELQFPDEAALLIGGRAGEHIGFLLEASLWDSADSTKTMFTSFKMPITYDVADTKLGIIPFTTDSGGASYGFELLNTGALKMQRVLENNSGKDTSAQLYIGTSGTAEGFAFVAANKMFFVNYSLWGPAHGSTDFSPFMSYVRLAATPNVGGWDLGVGGQLWRGTGKYNGTTRTKADAFAVDAQAQGNVGLPLGVYLTYGDAKKSKTNEVANMFNSNTAGDKKAWSLLAELGVLPGKATVAAGYRSGKTGATAYNKQNAITLGATYLLAQNVELQLNHSIYSGSYYDLPANNEQSNGDRLTTLMLFAAF
ncbi:MAG: hypothetical protein HZB81_07545 [Deltaproteobacteria bacterium]|nr:hypothetical protein [Deltaproteobacteria bacterium]